MVPLLTISELRSDGVTGLAIDEILSSGYEHLIPLDLPNTDSPMGLLLDHAGGLCIGDGLFQHQDGGVQNPLFCKNWSVADGHCRVLL
jgi:hypothetical protein